MRRLVVGTLAVLGLLVGLLAPVAPAVADDPPTVSLLDPPSSVSQDGSSVWLVATLTPSADDTVFDWDLDADGAFDDAHAASVLWNPQAYDLGTHTVAVKATSGGVVYGPATWDIEVIESFSVSLFSFGTVGLGRKAALFATVKGVPTGATATVTWDLDGDDVYDDTPITEAGGTWWDSAVWATTTGFYPVRVQVRHSDQAPGDPSVFATTTINVIPVVTLADVAVTGSPEVGQLLTANGGAADPADATRTFTWLRDGTPIPNATAPTYTPVAADGGHQVAVRVNASRSGFDAADPRTSPPVAITVPTPPPVVALTAATAAGTATVGHVLTATGGTATPSDATRTVTWLRDGAAVATGPTFLLTKADAGHRITVRVGATHSGYDPATPVTSPARAVPAYNSVRPSYTGTTRVGRRLTGAPGTWYPASGFTRTYRWLRDGRPISGATARTYVTRSVDRGHRISFRVTLARTGFPTVSAVSVSRIISR